MTSSEPLGQFLPSWLPCLELGHPRPAAHTPKASPRKAPPCPYQSECSMRGLGTSGSVPVLARVAVLKKMGSTAPRVQALNPDIPVLGHPDPQPLPWPEG